MNTLKLALDRKMLHASTLYVLDADSLCVHNSLLSAGHSCLIMFGNTLTVFLFACDLRYNRNIRPIKKLEIVMNWMANFNLILSTTLYDKVRTVAVTEEKKNASSAEISAQPILFGLTTVSAHPYINLVVEKAHLKTFHIAFGIHISVEWNSSDQA